MVLENFIFEMFIVSIISDQTARFFARSGLKQTLLTSEIAAPADYSSLSNKVFTVQCCDLT